MERTQKLARDAHSLASWLLIMAVACVGCRTPVHQHQNESPIAGCKAGCDSPHCARNQCAAYCVASCFGYEPTCWSRWPAACPSNCPIEGDLPADPAVFLQEEVIFDGVYEADPPWKLPSSDVEPMPDSPSLPDGQSAAEPLPSNLPVSVPQASSLAKGTVRSGKSDNESSPSRPAPRTEMGSARSVRAPRNAPLLTDVDPRITSISVIQTPNRDAPTAAGITTFDAAKAAEASAPFSSRRRANRSQPVRVPEIAQTAAITTAEEMPEQGMVRTAGIEIEARDNAMPLVSRRREPTRLPFIFSRPESGPATAPMAAPVPAVADPNVVTNVDRSTQGFNIRRLPEVEDVKDVTPMLRPQARPVSSDGKATIRFTQDKGRTSAAFGDASGAPATVRFR